MATVVYGWLAWKSQMPVLWIVALLGIALVGISRVFGCSRFIHQVMLYILALNGLVFTSLSNASVFTFNSIFIILP